jgi:hypothetical protein
VKRKLQVPARVKPKTLTLAKVRVAANAAQLAATILASIVREDDEGAKLAVAVKALRTIASVSEEPRDSGDRVRGIARGALRRIGC